MAKSQDKDLPEKEPEKGKYRKRKGHKALVGRVKKVVRKSRRKLGEEKFEKELQRTIVFLERMQRTLAASREADAAAKSKPAAKSAAPKSQTGNGDSD
jgi:hypothetical protein